MPRQSFYRPRPLFFIHTIDPLLWILLIIFVRPFFRIVCFQYQGVREKGFKRLEISLLSAEEFGAANKEGLKFARRVDLLRQFRAVITVTDQTLDLSRYFAKEALRFYTDLVLSAKMLDKMGEKDGAFAFTPRVGNRALAGEFIDFFSEATGFSHLRSVQVLVSPFPYVGRAVAQCAILFASFGALVLKRKKAAGSPLERKTLLISSFPSELEPDCLRYLSAGFFIDGVRIKKEDILFLGKDSPQARKWREGGYHFQSLFDLADGRLLVESFVKLCGLLIRSPGVTISFLAILPPWLLPYLILTELLIEKYHFRGLIYTNSDVGCEPIQSLSFAARKIPVVLFYYSASTFAHPMWAFLQATHIFVWNEDMIRFLQSHPQGGEKRFFVSGPLMQVEDRLGEETLKTARREFDLVSSPAKKIHVGLFDIAPANRDLMENQRFVQNPKLTREIHRNFLFDVFSLGEEYKDVRILIKPKRWSAKHDLDPAINEYIDGHREFIVLLPPSLNPQIAIQSCDLVICFPFTSIFFAALQKGVPGMFYYPFADSGLRKIALFQPFTAYGRDNLGKRFQDFYEGRAHRLDAGESAKLCGIETGAPVRERFIGELSRILG